MVVGRGWDEGGDEGERGRWVTAYEAQCRLVRGLLGIGLERSKWLGESGGGWGLNVRGGWA